MNKEFKVLVRPIYSKEEFKEETLILKAIDCIGWEGKKENKIWVYFFETPRGRIAINPNSNYKYKDKVRYFSIYPGYVDNMEYEFGEDFVEEGL